MSDPSIVNPGDSSYSIPQPTTTNVGDVPQMPLERTLPRQVSTGQQRGTQTLSGEQLVSDPTTNNAVITTSGIEQNQKFSDPNTQNDLVIVGKQNDGSYGFRLLDSTGNQLAQFGKQTDDSYTLQFNDSLGNPVARFGQQSDGTVNLKFYDTPTDALVTPLGLAQFGRFPDGSTALKIAQSGYEVATAVDSELVFNSEWSTMQISVQGIAVIPTTNLATGNIVTQSATVNYPDTGSIPIVLAYISAGAYAGTLWSGMIPLAYGVGGSITINQMDVFTSTITSHSVIFNCRSSNATGSTQTVGGYSIRFYVLTQNL